MKEELERLIHGKSLLIPTELLESLPKVSRNRKGRDVTAAVWAYLHVRHQVRRQDQQFISVSFQELQEALGVGSETISNAKTFLFEKDFLNVSSSYAAGFKSKGYQPLVCSKLVEYVPSTIDAGAVVNRQTADDENSQFTRSVLDKLEFHMGPFPAAFDEQSREGDGDPIRTVYPVAKLVQRGGWVSRDWTGRMQSPFAHLCKKYRPCFTLDGRPMTSVDMRACHPNLLGLVSGDEGLVADCVADRLYHGVAETVGCSRDDAKEPYFAFCYGSIKKHETEQNRTQFALQKLFAKKYPKAWAFMQAKKKRHYKTFSIDMIKLESELFIDGVLTSLRRLGIECLTVHDAVYFAESAGNERIVKKVIFETLQQKFTFLTHNHIYLKSNTPPHPSHYMSSVSTPGLLGNVATETASISAETMP